MKQHNSVMLITTIAISFMILLFTIMMIFIGNHFNENASDADDSTEAFWHIRETETGRVQQYNTEKMETQDSEDEISGTEVTDNHVFLSDEVDLALDDTAARDVQVENTYINSVELLPSITNEHEMVLKTNVSTSNFSSSYAGEETATITIREDETGEATTSVSVPASITLYNNGAKGSGTYDVATQINGDQSIIRSVGWSSPDSSIIGLSDTSGFTTTISRASDYTGTMTVKMVVTYYTASNATATEAYDIPVTVSDMTDTETKLYDNNGIELFLDKDGTAEAHLSDYASNDRYYGAIKTTGWQEIDEQRYYYNYDSLPVTGTQYIGGTKYEFDENGVMLSGVVGRKGIDVSLYQKKIDWEQVAASGITFAIIRCGFRGSSTGRLVEDVYFRSNIEGAKAAGIQVGVYFFTQALNEAEAKEEAAMVAGLCSNYSLDLPIFIDSENAINGRANGLDRDTRTRLIHTFCTEIAAAGYHPGVYASKSWFYDNLNTAELEQYVIWVAQYNNVCDYTGKKDYWQYSSKEHVNGIEGNVDMDIVY